ncbi:hypothetical protein B4U79_10947 [Dinothrombium tinctorium]|uniref:Uncharacterized protein n=1 Tax=Dinothrombium tinctorium TaxID=1965070 RepID=A0A3S3NW27_9ACAR|nr:hypothetical protein B4U79_10947 [Dinothrombium tinctorium]
MASWHLEKCAEDTVISCFVCY